MKLFTIVFLLFCTFVIGNSQVIINEINVDDQWVELYNPSNTTVDVNSWRLCRRPSYATISNLTIISGNTMLGPGDYVVIEWSQINRTRRELGLYGPSGGFGSATAIRDYVQYGGVSSPSRATLAVSVGLWEDVSKFVPYPTDFTKTLQNFNSAATGPEDTNSNHWWEGDPTMLMHNTCIDNYTLLNSTRIGNSEMGNADYETDGKLESDQMINSTAIVDYDSGVEVLLLANFEVELGALFEAFIDGCNEGLGGTHN